MYSFLLRTTLSLILCSTATSNVWAALTYQWPMGTSANLTGTFGPRNYTPSAAPNGWFHAGIDQANLGAFSAPYDLKVIKFESIGDNSYIDAVPTGNRNDRDFDMTHIRFRHVVIPGDMAVNKTYLVGAQIAYLQTGPNHLDMKCWFYNYPDERNATSHPLKWFTYDLKAEKEETKITITRGLQVDAGGSHVKVSVVQPRAAMSLNKLDFAFGDYLGSSLNTGDYMGVTNKEYTVWYEKRTNINPDPLQSRTFTPFKFNGIKIEPYSGVIPTKTVDFKIYCFKAPQVVEFLVKDPKGNVIASKNDLQFSSCTGCTPPSNAPRPPPTLTATRVANGVRLNWNISPDFYGTISTGYVIYRRLASSTNILDASPIGTLAGDIRQFTDFVYDEKNQQPDINYKYSIAAINPNGEGCTGPLSNTSCRPPAGKTCLEYCGAPLEKTASMPTGNAWFQPFNYDPNNVVGDNSDISWWGFTKIGNGSWYVDPYSDDGTAFPLASTLLQSNTPGGGYLVPEALSPAFSANRNESGLTYSWSIRFQTVPNLVRNTNTFATSLLNSSGQFLYTTTFKPTGLYDPWSGIDIELSKNNSTSTSILGQALTSMDTPSWKWMKFRMTVAKTTSAGGDGTVRVFMDIGDGRGFRQYISVKDEQHTTFQKLYIAWATGTSSDNMQVFLDNFKVSKGLCYAEQ